MPIDQFIDVAWLNYSIWIQQLTCLLYFRSRPGNVILRLVLRRIVASRTRAYGKQLTVAIVGILGFWDGTSDYALDISMVSIYLYSMGETRSRTEDRAHAWMYTLPRAQCLQATLGERLFCWDTTFPLTRSSVL